MSFYDKVPSLGLDAFIADVQDVNKSIHFEDIKLAVHHIFNIKDKQHELTIKGQKHSENRKPKNVTSLFIRCFTIMCIVFGCLLSLPVICHEIINFIDMSLNSCWDDVSPLKSIFPDFILMCSVIFRKIALSMRFQETFSVTGLDFHQCILDNPLHKLMLQTPLNCEFCTEFDQPFYVTTDLTSVTRDSMPLFQPLLFQRQGTELDLEQLQQLLRKNTHMVNSDTVSISSNRPYIKNVEDFMKESIPEQLHQDGETHILWKSLSYLSAHILRPVVPQPQQFFENVLRTYRSAVRIDGHLSPPYKLHPSRNEPQLYFMYVQLSGSRRLVFSPVQDCASTCSSFTVIMKPKDVVSYDGHLWSVTSEAFEDGTSLSVTDEFHSV